LTDTSYVGSVEIFSYLKAVSIKHDLEKYIRYSHKLISAIWNEEKGVWKLEFEVPVPGHADQTLTIGGECNVLLNACGVLNNW
jgi:cation diffusion facilitator CzcD-associated flavoprotein CzcO